MHDVCHNRNCYLAVRKRVRTRCTPWCRGKCRW